MSRSCPQYLICRLYNYLDPMFSNFIYPDIFSFVIIHLLFFFLFFFFNDTATTEIYTLSLHDALPISLGSRVVKSRANSGRFRAAPRKCSAFSARNAGSLPERSSSMKVTPPDVPMPGIAGGENRSEEHTLNSSHSQISYAVFCLKK